MNATVSTHSPWVLQLSTPYQLPRIESRTQEVSLAKLAGVLCEATMMTFPPRFHAVGIVFLS
jgi:hypothetical protein